MKFTLKARKAQGFRVDLIPSGCVYVQALVVDPRGPLGLALVFSD